MNMETKLSPLPEILYCRERCTFHLSALSVHVYRKLTFIFESANLLVENRSVLNWGDPYQISVYTLWLLKLRDFWRADSEDFVILAVTIFVSVFFFEIVFGLG